MITQTINSLQTAYLTYLQAQNSQINAFAPNSYWSIISGAEAGSFLDLYANLQLVTNSIFVQNAVGDQVDLWLYRQGLPARGGLTYGSIQATVAGSPVTIAADTIFSDSATGNQYQTLQEWVVSSGTQQITLYAMQPGNNYLEPIGNTLSDGTHTITVVASTNGQVEESDQSCIERVLMSIREPVSGSRATDYFNYSLEASSQVTWAIVIRSFVVIDSVSILGVFPLVGIAITEYQLNQGLLPDTTFTAYSRQAGTDVIDTVNTYIQNLRLVGLSVIAGTSDTETVATTDDAIPILVSLADGYSLGSILNIQSQDIDGNPITIQLTISQLVQREARRAICNQAFGGTNISGQNYITINSIIDALNNQLSVFNGQIAQVLTNITIAIPDIAVPNYNASTTDVMYTYDIENYSSIVVSST